MADDRTTIIINEIKYWKQHKLLPEVYCDFLLALYTKGDYQEEVLEEKKSNNKWLFFVQVFLLILLVPFSIVVIYFTQFESILQLGILILFVSYTFGIYLFYKKQNNKYIHIPLNVMLLLLLLLTLFVTGLFIPNQWISLVVLLINFGVWLLIAYKFNYKYLLIFSIIGMVMSMFYNFSQLFPLN